MIKNPLKFGFLLLMIACNSKNASNSDSPRKEILTEVEKVDKQMMSDVNLLGSALKVRGRIIASKSFSDFPEITQSLVDLKLGEIANQLLVVDVGETALLVTTKTSFSTTGLFSIKAMRLMNTKTNMGSIPVIIEFSRYDEVLESFKKGDEKIRKLAVQYLQTEIPSLRIEALNMKKKS